ncbi:fumarylacetoacetate hydrolase family protein, partial [Schumannella luteola]
MRLVTFATAAGSRPGAVVGEPGAERVLDLSDVAPRTVDIVGDPEALGEALAAVGMAADSAWTPLGDLRLEPPVTPGKILCLGYNYRGHVPDGVDPTADDPEYPDVFVKTPNTLGAPGDEVVIPDAALDVDYEGEIALVIGRRAKEVPLGEALSYIGGYTILNDVSDRAWQRRQSQWALGK